MPNPPGGRTPYIPRNRRRVLCVFPRYGRSFGTFHHAYGLMPGVRAFMPPQGILLIASYLPESWEVRFVDENMRPATGRDVAWADAVLVSGMHIQRAGMNALNDLAHRHGKVTAIGGPSASACPERYPDFDYVHVGELGDATDRLIERLDLSSARPAEQARLETVERLPLGEFPVPAYGMIDLGRYFLASVQFSSGCPYLCEFCDIPELYGKKARLKSPERVCAELDAMLASGNPGAAYFVDDNFIADRHAAEALLPHLIAWQKRNGYPVQFACEATLNIAQYPALLAMMREAYFCTVFCGIETPEPGALKFMRKPQNLSMPILDAVRVLNEHGMEVVSGIILGLDTDTPDTAGRLIEFIDRSKIPMLTINLLQALPRTPLWRRLEAEGRIVADDRDRESNVEFRLPYEDVVGMWRRCVETAYAPAALYARFRHAIEHTYPNRITPPPSKARVNLANIVKGLAILFQILVRVGILGSYRRTFWDMALPALRAGDIESVIHVGLVSHHLIEFTRECAQGQESASFYSQKRRNPPARKLAPVTVA